MTTSDYITEVNKAAEQDAFWAMEEARSGLGYSHTRNDLAKAIRYWRKMRRESK